ncbi:MAG: DUF2141 domain-containing protein [Mariprofundaceae bacterium]
MIRSCGIPVLLMLMMSAFTPTDIYAADMTGALRIEVTGLKSSKGAVAFALYDSASRYKKHTDPLRSASRPINNRSCVWQTGELPYGEYAVMLYHDENGNGRLDSGLFHIPVEPYGLSNNARSSFGPASYEDTKFVLKAPLKMLVIKVK